MQTHSAGDPKLPIARLNDLQVSAPFENRGMGSMLVREALQVCKRLAMRAWMGISAL